jgi:hypothetical protein
MKRIFLFLLTNIAVLVVLSVVVRLLGLDRALAANGLNVGALLVFSAVSASPARSFRCCCRNRWPNGRPAPR